MNSLYDIASNKVFNCGLKHVDVSWCKMGPVQIASVATCITWLTSASVIDLSGNLLTGSEMEDDEEQIFSWDSDVSSMRSIGESIGQRIEKLMFVSCGLGCRGLGALARAVNWANAERLEHVDLSRNSITNNPGGGQDLSGFESFCAALSHSKISKLGLSDCNLNGDAILRLIKSFGQDTYTEHDDRWDKNCLKSIDLSGNFFCHDDKAVCALAKAITYKLPKLVELGLARCNLGPETLTKFVNKTNWLHYRCSLESLHLNGNPLAAGATDYFCKFDKQWVFGRGERLDGVRALQRVIHNSKISVLDLSNCGLPHQALEIIKDAIVNFKTTPCLATLNLLKNPIGEQGLEVASALLHEAPILGSICGIKEYDVTLNLSKRGLNVTDMNIVTTDYRANKFASAVHEVDLSMNARMDLETGTAVVKLLPDTHIRTLKIANGLQLDLQQCSRKVLNCADQGIGPGEIIILSWYLRDAVSSSITSLDLSGNHFGLEGKRLLGQALPETNLKLLTMNIGIGVVKFLSWERHIEWVCQAVEPIDIWFLQQWLRTIARRESCQDEERDKGRRERALDLTMDRGRPGCCHRCAGGTKSGINPFEAAKLAAMKGIDLAKKGKDLAQKGLDLAQRGIDLGLDFIDGIEQDHKDSRTPWRINVSENGFKENGKLLIAEILKDTNISEITLDLGHACTKLSAADEAINVANQGLLPVDVGVLSAWISTRDTRLDGLDLSGNLISGTHYVRVDDDDTHGIIRRQEVDANVTGIEKLAETLHGRSLREGHAPTTIRTLNVSACSLGSKAIKELATCLPDGHLTYLDISQNLMGHKGARSLLRALDDKERPSSLCTLVFGMKATTLRLRPAPNEDTTETTTAGEPHDSETVTTSMMKEMPEQINTEQDLSNQKLGPVELRIISWWMSNCINCMDRVNLSGNPLTGTTRVADSRLELTNSQGKWLYDPDVTSFTEFVGVVAEKQIQILDLSMCGLGPAAFHAFADAFPRTCQLQSIDISNNIPTGRVSRKSNGLAPWLAGSDFAAWEKICDFINTSHVQVFKAASCCLGPRAVIQLGRFVTWELAALDTLQLDNNMFDPKSQEEIKKHGDHIQISTENCKVW